jgi:DNA-binding transcriptional regulator YhcF (GntR family)
VGKAKEEILKGRNLTRETRVERVGVVRVYGELELERLIKRLLNSKSIVG